MTLLAFACASTIASPAGAHAFLDHASPAVGSTGLLAVYINPSLPQSMKIPCVVAGERLEDNLRAAQLRFSGLSDAVVELLEKLIFRHHRRLIAGAKLAAH